MHARKRVQRFMESLGAVESGIDFLFIWSLLNYKVSKQTTKKYYSVAKVHAAHVHNVM